MSLLFVKLVFLLVFANVDSARILGVYPTPSISHQVVFRALTLELVNRGHELVVITPDPVFKNKESPKNLIEIDTSDNYKLLLEAMTKSDFSKHIKRGAIMDADAITSSTVFYDMLFSIFNNTQVIQLMEDKNQKFDLVIFEAMALGSLMFAELFKAPAIMFSSLYGFPDNYETVGAVSRHPVFHPYIFRKKYRNLNLLEHLEQLYMEYKLWNWEYTIKENLDKHLVSRFGEVPSVREMEKYVQLLFVNSHPIFDGNRPVPPATVYLGRMHLQPAKPLPEDLKSYLDKSKRGVIYVSLGTNVRPSYMDKDLLDAFLDAFEKIPFDILWKFDGDHLNRVPKNVKVQKWFPQRDLLSHPNIKLFVMQGGLQSTDEAIEAEVPLVGIPFLGDQWYNTDKFEQLGIGVCLDSYTLVADDLVKAVEIVTTNPSYKENIQKLKAVMKDQRETPVERAVWWTEHVLRHKNSRHLLGPAAQMSWSEYMMLDILIPLPTGLISLILITVYIVIYLIKKVLGTNSKDKVKRH